MAGQFGYELDVTKLTAEERETVKRQIVCYKKIHNLVCFGNQYRLLKCDDTSYYAWMYVSEKRENAVVTIVSKNVGLNESKKRIYSSRLGEKAIYRMGNRQYSCSVFMYMGIEYANVVQYNSEIIFLQKVGEFND